ncbi:hypothetical protein HanPSC8_Chr10g0432521 [Helianthus annuus]|nr:hypothetical protein HanPSC8_Chr10g0432521 [Helianthus annuus]
MKTIGVCDGGLTADLGFNGDSRRRLGLGLWYKFGRAAHHGGGVGRQDFGCILYGGKKQTD